jgi:hypothetical protein
MPYTQQECYSRCGVSNNTPTDNSNNYTSTDPYVNEKLQEINDCFLNNYNSHLENLDNSINKLKSDMAKVTDDKSKKKYENAIKKLEEIKSLFIKRYKNVIDFDSAK